jgi:hypothetical protein
MEYTEKQAEQRRQAVKKYTSESVDRVNCLLPKGTKERIKEVAPNKSINAFIKEVVLLQLETLEKLK